MTTSKPVIGIYQPYPHTFGGVQSMVLKLVQGLPALGYSPLVISPENGSFTATLSEEGHPYIVSDPGPSWHTYGRGSKTWSYLLSVRRLLHLMRYWRRLSIDLRRNKVALLHCNDYRGVILAAPAARLARIPVIWHMHGFIPSILANVVTPLLVDWVVPVSAGMLEYLKVPRWLFGKCEVICNGIEEPTEPMAATPFSAPEPIVLAVGSLHPRKGYETLIRAFKDVATRVPRAECWIVGGEFGDGTYARELYALTTRLGLTRHIKFLGARKDAMTLMRQCTLVAIPSRIEAFGMVAIEAMLMGRPVVASRTGGLSDIILHRRTGCLVEPEKPSALAIALIEILHNPPLATQMGKAGQTRAIQTFSLARMIKSFANFYGTLLHQT